MKLFLLSLGLIVLSLGSAIPEPPVPDAEVAAAAVKDLVFDCSDGHLGDVCINMCYGANCKGLGNLFTWDKPGLPLQRKRSRLAGCGSPNRCSKAPYGSGYQCDEYPFKSVKEADKGKQVNRCVKKHYNRRQGNVLKDFYNSYGQFRGMGCNKQYPCKFRVGFMNDSKFGYCKRRPNCRNDGNQYTKAGPAKREETVDNSGYYRLGDGKVVFFPGGASVGDLVLIPSFTNSNATMDVEALTENDEDESYGGDDYVVQEEHIVEEVVDYEE